MARVLVCDVCRKPTNRIVGKVLYIPVNDRRFSYSNYSAHADIGECCASRFNDTVRFRKRKRHEKKPANARST